ncbi:MAG: glycosyltransferase family 39 protein [Ardenticatenia bacterium]|nr:glycosyltransferase family 39 protein [Ardenticatenia bacterium]
MRTPDRLLLSLMLLWFLGTATLYAWRTPRWQAPDEPAHFNYVRYVAETGRPPVLVAGCYDQAYLERLKRLRFPPSLPVDRLCYEAHQPPLYYYLAAVPYRLALAVGADPLLAVRLFSVLLGGGVVAVTAALVRTLFPTPPDVALATAGVVAAVPMHVAMLASANNDALAELVLALTVWHMVRLLKKTTSRPLDWYMLGGLLGLALLTKTTAYLAFPLALAVVWWRREVIAAQARGSVVLALCIALALGLPWFVRNSLVYGGTDVLGLQRHEAVVVGQPRTAEWLAELGVARLVKRLIVTTFHSFWGQFGWMAAPLPSWAYSPLWILTSLAGMGWGLRLWARRHLWPSAVPRGYALLALWIGLNVLAYGWYNLTFVQHQGRYLFPSLPALALFLVLGLQEWIAPPYRRIGLGAMVIGLAGLTWWSLWAVLPGLAP